MDSAVARDPSNATATRSPQRPQRCRSRVSLQAQRWIGRVDGDRAFVDMIAVDHVQIPVVEVVDVATMLDGGVAASGTVNMIVGDVRGTRRHGKSYRGRGQSCCQFKE